MGAKLLETMARKKTNLSVAADYTSAEQVAQLSAMLPIALVYARAVNGFSGGMVALHGQMMHFSMLLKANGQTMKAERILGARVFFCLLPFLCSSLLSLFRLLRMDGLRGGHRRGRESAEGGEWRIGWSNKSLRRGGAETGHEGQGSGKPRFRGKGQEA